MPLRGALLLSLWAALPALGAEAPPVGTAALERTRPFTRPIDLGRPGPPFKLERDGPAWWLVSPEGRRFFSLGVCVVDRGETRGEYDPANPSYAARRKYSDPVAWASATLGRLRSWGFTTIGGWSDDRVLRASPAMDSAFTPVLHLGSTAGAPWFDLWDDKVTGRMEEVARKAIEAARDDPRLLGYYTDNELGWWNAALVKMAFEQPASSGNRRRLIGLLRKRYQDDWKKLLADFEPEGAADFAELANAGRLYLRGGGSGIGVLREFLSVIARRYYRLAREIVRRHDRRALILGDRYQSFYYPEVAREAAAEVDVVSTNLNVSWNDGTLPVFFLATLHALTEKPILIGEFYLAAGENRTGSRNSHGLFPMARTQAERAQAIGQSLRSLARLPFVVGADWFQYYDEPPLGRYDGEDFAFGLVDVEDRPYDAATATFAAVDPFAIKQAPAPRRPDASGGIPRARGDPRDGFTPLTALKDWDRLAGFIPSTSPFPLADLYITWDPRALYLGLVALSPVEGDYYRDGKVPEEDRTLWSVEIPGVAKPFSARLGAGRPPSGLEGGAELMVISEEQLPSRLVAILRIPAALLAKDTLMAGDAVRISSTLIGHARAWKTVWAGDFKLAE